ALELMHTSVPGRTALVRRARTEELADIRERDGLGACERSVDLAFEGSIEALDSLLKSCLVCRFFMMEPGRALTEALAVELGGRRSTSCALEVLSLMHDRAVSAPLVGDASLSGDLDASCFR
ncbi:MAG: hypothetical protein M3Q30_18565, partial [Actinomycetota bacterium]|nr:hypothetical protein [Actinomycetota bacterium]